MKLRLIVGVRRLGSALRIEISLSLMKGASRAR